MFMRGIVQYVGVKPIKKYLQQLVSTVTSLLIHTEVLLQVQPVLNVVCPVNTTTLMFYCRMWYLQKQSLSA